MCDFQQYLLELQTWCDDEPSTNQDAINYFDLVSSYRRSKLSLHSTNMLPPLLSESDRQKMREYRKKAIDVEKSLHSNRRKKYDVMRLKVTELTDKLKDLNKSKNNLSEPKTNEIVKSEFLPLKNEKSQASTSSYNRNSTLEQKTEKSSKEKEAIKIQEKENIPLPSSLFQKPKLHHSSSFQSRSITKGFENLSLNNKIQKNEMLVDNMGNTTEGSMIGKSVESSVSTLKASNQSTPTEMANDRTELHLTDSLASTVLSMAYTDSSYASQYSTLEQPSKAHRQLNMDQANETLYESYYHKVNPLTSTPTNLHNNQPKPNNKKKSATATTSISGSVYTKADAQQDKALEKLEIMKQKLLQEKEKQMLVLKQQELSRLRTVRSQTGHYSEGSFENSPQGHYSSRPNSDMYSIPEQSFEGSLTMQQEEDNDLESASDKENIVYKEDPYHNDYNGNTFEKHVLPGNNGYSLNERSSGEFDSRPISVQSKESISGKANRRSNIYVRKEFQKQFEVEMKQEDGKGREKFYVLSAYTKGFLTRRILKAEKVQAIVKTIKDTTEFLSDISKEGSISYQDKSLQERVQAQLLAAKQKLHDIFFKVSVDERMAYISHSRNAAKEREDRLLAKKTVNSKQLSRKISAATMKAMQRRKSESNLSNDVTKPSTSSQLGKRTIDTRALKPVQSTKSPQTTSRAQSKRRSLASPLARRSVVKKTSSSRPATALGTRLPSNRKSLGGHSSTEADKSLRQSRLSLDNRPSISKRSKPAIEPSNQSKLPVKKHASGSQTYRLSSEEQYKDDKVKSRSSTSNLVSTKRQADNRPKTAVGVRRVTRSMAAQFNKQ